MKFLYLVLSFQLDDSNWQVTGRQDARHFQLPPKSRLAHGPSFLECGRSRLDRAGWATAAPSFAALAGSAGCISCMLSNVQFILHTERDLRLNLPRNYAVSHS
jgi:hypothetical protein